MPSFVSRRMSIHVVSKTHDDAWDLHYILMKVDAQGSQWRLIRDIPNEQLMGVNGFRSLLSIGGKLWRRIRGGDPRKTSWLAYSPISAVHSPSRISLLGWHTCEFDARNVRNVLRYLYHLTWTMRTHRGDVTYIGPNEGVKMIQTVQNRVGRRVVPQTPDP